MTRDPKPDTLDTDGLPQENLLEFGDQHFARQCRDFFKSDGARGVMVITLSDATSTARYLSTPTTPREREILTIAADALARYDPLTDGVLWYEDADDPTNVRATLVRIEQQH